MLENYHSSLLFQILKCENSNIVKDLPKNDQKIFRKYVINMILDTDLTKNFQLISKFKSLSALGDAIMNEEANRTICLSMVIKCADVGHGAK